MTASGIGALPCGVRSALVADRQRLVRSSSLPEDGLAGQARGYAMSRQRDVMTLLQSAGKGLQFLALSRQDGRLPWPYRADAKYSRFKLARGRRCAPASFSPPRFLARPSR